MLNKNRIFLFFIIFLFFASACDKNEKLPDEKPDEIIDDIIVDEKNIPEWKLGDVFFDTNKWTECIVGDMPLVISVPHGGNVKPTNIPDRTCDDATTVRDSYTIEIAKAIEKEMMIKYGKKPFIIISHLARTKLDQNRALEESSCGNTDMNATWRKFHNYIDTALNVAVKKYGEVLYIDLHAHGHTIQRLELGYSLSISELGYVYTGTDLPNLGNKSSLNNLLKTRKDLNINQLLIGDKAFGTLMANRGAPSVPSKQNAYPMASDPYFNGGYNTRLYTSSTYPNVYGWQIEMNSEARNTTARQTAFAKTFIESVTEFQNYVNP